MPIMAALLRFSYLFKPDRVRCQGLAQPLLPAVIDYFSFETEKFVIHASVAMKRREPRRKAECETNLCQDRQTICSMIAKSEGRLRFRKRPS